MKQDRKYKNLLPLLFFLFENEDMGHLNEQEGLKRKRYIYFRWQMQKCNEVVVLNVKRLAKIIDN